jgi:hypothetical protein
LKHTLAVLIVASAIIGIFILGAFAYTPSAELHSRAAHASIDLCCLFGQLLPPLACFAATADRARLIGQAIFASAVPHSIDLPRYVPPPRSVA